MIRSIVPWKEEKICEKISKFDQSIVQKKLRNYERNNRTVFHFPGRKINCHDRKYNTKLKRRIFSNLSGLALFWTNKKFDVGMFLKRRKDFKTWERPLWNFYKIDTYLKKKQIKKISILDFQKNNYWFLNCYLNNLRISVLRASKRL